jgi:multifunctional methyltransferase subunit TRM112
MKLLTHNILMCNNKDCSINNYPLKIIANKIINKKHEFDEDSIKRFIKKIDFKGLKSACDDLNINLKYDFDSLSEEQKNSSEFLQYMNNILFELIIEDGKLICNNCRREYKIENGITNFMINDEQE